MNTCSKCEREITQEEFDTQFTLCKECIAESKTCINCGGITDGKHCPHCGICISCSAV